MKNYADIELWNCVNRADLMFYLDKKNYPNNIKSRKAALRRLENSDCTINLYNPLTGQSIVIDFAKDILSAKKLVELAAAFGEDFVDRFIKLIRYDR